MVSADSWPFDQPRNCAVFTSRHVLEGTEAILRVTHDSDDHGWQFLGREAHEEDAKIIALHEAVEMDPSILQLVICLQDGMLGVIPQKSHGRAKRWMMQSKPSNQAMQLTAL